jgi:hypothetical protein
MSVIVMAPVEIHKSAVGISISLGKSNFVFMYRGGWFGLVIVGAPLLLATREI